MVTGVGVGFSAQLRFEGVGLVASCSQNNLESAPTSPNPFFPCPFDVRPPAPTPPLRTEESGRVVRALDVM